MSYETDLARIEDIVGSSSDPSSRSTMHSGCSKRGSSDCARHPRRLVHAEARVRKLIEDTDGGFTLADFES